MIRRFQGEHGEKRLLAAIQGQSSVGDDIELARALCSVSVLSMHPGGSNIITQAATDNDIFFILAGIASVRINGREVAQRTARQHVGEMALIDPSAPRSADVVALSDVVTARVAEHDFAAIAEKWPKLWRTLASELSGRLRQRAQHVVSKNERPRLFVGSSKEALVIAQAIQVGLAHDPIEVMLWTDNIFKPSQYPLESLATVLTRCDFALLVLNADDQVFSRGVGFDAPRDNVIFELGYFSGYLGYHRTFLLTAHGVDLKIPSDLIGLTPLTYTPGAREDMASWLGATCTSLRTRILEMGPK